MYTFSKTLSKQKIGFWGNLDPLGKNLLSNALNRVKPSHVNKTYNAFKTPVLWTWGLKGYETKKNFENLSQTERNLRTVSIIFYKEKSAWLPFEINFGAVYLYITMCLSQTHRNIGRKMK